MNFILPFIFLLSQVQFSLEIVGVVERITPKGFRIKTSNYIIDDRISHVVFNVNINRPLEPDGSPDFVANITESNGGQWFYDNINVHTEAGTKIHFRLDVFYNESESNAGNSTKMVRNVEKIAVLRDEAIDISVSASIEEKCAEKYTISEKCELGVTTVRGQSVCKDKLIFEEHFDKLELDPKIWKIDARIPLDKEDSPFVSYQNDPQIVFIQNGRLYIKPRFQWEALGFNESTMRTGTLKIDGCSGTKLECSRTAKFSQILPPIISARIRTKHSFSFRYGKVIIRAKMPKGDWIMPLLFLEPLENYYGFSNYASGQIRIASSRGNQVLLTNDGVDISNNHLSGGVVLEHGGPLYGVNLQHYFLKQTVVNSYHNFTLTWSEEGISVGVDDYEYGQWIQGGFSKLYPYENADAWDSQHKMAPFDREFYLTIGLSVGGHADFPDLCKNGDNGIVKPWKNSDPKAMLHFWKDRENWMKTWRNLDTKFSIDSILIYAV